VTVIDTREHKAVATLKFELKGMRAADITPVGIVLSRDGKRAFVGLGRANHVAFIDVATRKVTEVVLVGKRAWGLALDKAGPDGMNLIMDALRAYKATKVADALVLFFKRQEPSLEAASPTDVGAVVKDALSVMDAAAYQAFVDGL
jgi:YVTN family beta-propeller protein